MVINMKLRNDEITAWRIRNILVLPHIDLCVFNSSNSRQYESRTETCQVLHCVSVYRTVRIPY